ncbi:hypothetical protein M0534_07895 [Methylonatrum kenyense]|uniref:YhdP family phospholipid transporter n=1 Tax=Methylonatrum kenyense TaxID=455253 RepID=UPI0020BF8C9C|nr:DUF3971 domain-containing protein [Methylonatrum kenyense]MCK8516247.1 hypothetical protein [Methylonatrum kenyense]
MVALVYALMRWLTYGTVAVLVLLAVAVSLLRAAPALAPFYQDALEDTLAELSGRPVALGGLELDWHGLRPGFSVAELHLGGDDEDAGIRLQGLWLQLDAAASVRERRPVLAAVELSSLDLTLQRTLDGRWHLLGAGVAQQPEFQLDWLNRLAGQVERIRLHDGRVQIQDLRRAETVVVEELRLDLQLGGGVPPRLAARGRLPEAWGGGLDLRAQWDAGTGELEHRRLRAYLQMPGLRPGLLEAALSVPVGEMPSANLRGDLELWLELEGGLASLVPGDAVTDREVAFTLGLNDGALVFPGLFRGELPFSSLQAGAALHFRRGDDWVLDLHSVDARTADGRLRGHALFGRRHGSPLYLDIHGRLQGEEGNVASTPRYLPAGIMPPALVDWLDRSLIDGTAREAEVNVQGFAPDFPFAHGEGRFEVLAELRDATLNYWPEWPALEEADGRLHFFGQSMDIRATEGRIGDAGVRGVAARIAVLGQTALTIDGEVEADGEAYLDFLRAMPLAGDGLRTALSAMRLDGRHPLALGLEVPFQGQPIAVNGRVDLRDAAFAVPDWDLRADRLSGSVRFTESGILADQVQGRFHGAPVRLRSHLDDPGRITLLAELDGVPVSALQAHVPAVDFLSGGTDVQLRARLPDFSGLAADEPLARLDFRSSMRGVGSNLPSPLDKAEDESTRLEVAFDVDPQLGPVRIAYGDRTRVLVLPGDRGVDGIGVRFGGEQPRIPVAGGLEVSGRLDTLDLAGWTDYRPREQGTAADGEGLPLRWLDLDVTSLRFNALELREVELFGVRENDTLQLTFSGTDALGSLAIPLAADAEEPFRADLDYLNLRGVGELTALNGDGGGPWLADGLQPADLPGLVFNIADLRLEERPLGRLALRAGPDADGDYVLENLGLSGADHELEARGGWQSADGVRLRGVLRSEDVGALLAGFGYGEMKRGGRGRLRANLQWPDGPQALRMDAMQGEMSLRLRDGQLVQVEPGAGRVFGLLSVALIPRRLNLDFGDVFEEGFAYDSLDAELSFANGIATPETLVMEGPSARIAVSGPVDLSRREYDQHVIVRPKASATLPLVGGLVGGLPGVAAMMLAEQLFRGGVDGAARADYRITGPWHAPEIERLGRFGTGVPSPDADGTGDDAPQSRPGRFGSSRP